VIHGDIIKESAQSRNLVITGEEKRVKNCFFQLKPHYKTSEPKKLKFHRLVQEKFEKTSKEYAFFVKN